MSLAISASSSLREVRRLEVGADPLRPERVDQRLHHRVRHRAEQIRDRLGDLAERRDQLGAALHGAGGHPDQRDDLLPVPRLRDHRQRRGGRQVDQRRHVVARGRRPFAEQLEQRLGGLRRVEDRPGVDDRPDGMQLELELRDDPEVAAAAAEAAQELRILALAGVHELAVGSDDVRTDQVVAGEPVAAHQPADPAAEREASDAGRRNEPAGGGEAVHGRLVVEVAPGRAAADVRDARRGVDAHAAHLAEVDHHATVDGREAGHAVAAAPDGDRQVVRASESDCGNDVRGAVGADDHGRPPAGVRPVPDLARLGVALVRRRQHLSSRGVPQLLHRCLAEHGSECLRHLVLPFLVRVDEVLTRPSLRELCGVLARLRSCRSTASTPSVSCDCR